MSLHALPIWKKDSTPVEWLQEVAALAMEYPERFDRIIVIYEECNKEKLPIQTRMCSRNIPSNTEILGVLESSKLETFEFMKGRRR